MALPGFTAETIVSPSTHGRYRSRDVGGRLGGARLVPQDDACREVCTFCASGVGSDFCRLCEECLRTVSRSSAASARTLFI